MKVYILLIVPFGFLKLCPRVPIAERKLCPSGTVPAAGNASPERHHLAESALLKTQVNAQSNSNIEVRVSINILSAYVSF